MLIHHIKPEQLPQLEKFFGKDTSFGLSIPSWLRQLRETATSIAKPNDFDVTLPGPEEIEGHRPRSF
jgi:hypothetical protein